MYDCGSVVDMAPGEDNRNKLAISDPVTPPAIWRLKSQGYYLNSRDEREGWKTWKLDLSRCL